MGRTAGRTGAPPLTRARTRWHDVEGRTEGGQITGEAVAQECRDAHDPRLRGCHDCLGGVERARPHHRRAHQAKRGGKAEPDPWPPVRTGGQAIARLARATPLLLLVMDALSYADCCE